MKTKYNVKYNNPNWIITSKDRYLLIDDSGELWEDSGDGVMVPICKYDEICLDEIISDIEGGIKKK